MGKGRSSHAHDCLTLDAKPLKGCVPSASDGDEKQNSSEITRNKKHHNVISHHEGMVASGTADTTFGSTLLDRCGFFLFFFDPLLHWPRLAMLSA